MTIEYKDFIDPENPDYLNFGDLVRCKLGLQCQYASRYVDGKIEGWDNLGEGLRFKGNTNNWHSLRIHKDDAYEFLKRVRQNWRDRENIQGRKFFNG